MEMTSHGHCDRWLKGLSVTLQRKVSRPKRASFHLPYPWHRLPEEDISQIKVGSSYLRRSELKVGLAISNDLSKKKFPTGQGYL